MNINGVEVNAGARGIQPCITCKYLNLHPRLRTIPQSCAWWQHLVGGQTAGCGHHVPGRGSSVLDTYTCEEPHGPPLQQHRKVMGMSLMMVPVLVEKTAALKNPDGCDGKQEE